MSDEAGLSNDEIFCKARAIEIARYFPLRERFWLNRLNGCRDAQAIFACGDLHIETFGQILSDNDVQYRIVRRGIGLTPEDERFCQALEYLSSS